MPTIGGIDVNTALPQSVPAPPVNEPAEEAPPPPAQEAPPPPAGALEEAQQPTPQGNNNPVVEAEIGGAVNIAV